MVEKKTYQIRQNHIYLLIGVDKFNKRASVNVTKSVWDKFDVPVTTVEKLKKKRDVQTYENNKKKRHRKSPVVPQKNKRKNYDENIERWIAEHYGLDYEKLANSPFKKDF